MATATATTVRARATRGWRATAWRGGRFVRTDGGRVGSRGPCTRAQKTHDHSHSHIKPESFGQKDIAEYAKGLKYNDKGLLVAIAQDVDTGDILMQAFANAEAVEATLRTGLGTFYSRSRDSLWCKGETSGHFLKVKRVFCDCDRDSLIYLCKPIGPACHTGEPTCWFEGTGEGAGGEDTIEVVNEMPRTTLQMLEETIRAREVDDEGGVGKSWTAKLLGDTDLLCSKVREEAGELCETLEKAEGKERAASEMADLLYHSMVLMRKQDVDMVQVMEVLRERFGVSGIDEKAARSKL
ncbi:histidine biosynthesis bifunctional protein hisIE [Chloropicon primus]|uniref:Bifunctional phosphoribosyl-AMP cyclohydrolase/phosphoribosyl-ATP pyrophosphatase n=1 Tax=Chloropicon primus TaxID=1764295 RepID=A0A5B8MW96_9CHLO|nr:bifunctional phosphoribosyl-AMP cyclohydrolase/phosphoribosyl-ATP pyrophosphatase [Chloropicon primus]UPR03135.1 histidine biosynthesis bifunctional protein hisIE [Chloropicon primus]|eukprot:QDZ23924.1 bifunctional phosphoribosyl-AMP cyclohydrolase/phosphoribosyl-ATP pyrophosphatase [Chloropicon primus]